ncbi:TlpA family protein disulfide reductase [Paenibacillus thalictri]|nr:TlpA disulfide reductase family protein [Paenibacillus thalictri]
MMDPIQLGPFFIKAELLPWIAALIIAYAALKYMVRRESEPAQRIPELFVNGVLLAFFTWKFSYIVTEPAAAVRNPMALLYFNGGEAGIWIAGAAITWLIWRFARKHKVAGLVWLDAICAVCLAGAAGYYTAMCLLERFSEIFHLLSALLSWGLLLLYAVSRNRTAGMARAQKGLLSVILLFAAFTWEEQLLHKAQPLAAMTEGVKPGQLAPDISLQTTEGKTVKLSDYRGKKVLLNFWASWCPPCRAEMPDLEQFYRESAGLDVVVLAVNMTNTEARRSDVDAFAANQGLTFPILLDTDGTAGGAYRVMAYPTSYWIDASGLVRDRTQGPMSKAAMKAWLRE